jgi:hypothetical protein
MVLNMTIINVFEGKISPGYKHYAEIHKISNDVHSNTIAHILDKFSGISEVFNLGKETK